MIGIEQAKTLSEADKALLVELKSVVQRVVPDAELFLYGSTARGERGPESDYDIMILLNEPLTSAEEDAIENAVYDLELAHGTVISLFFVTREKWNLPFTAATPFYRNVQREAIGL